MHHQYGPLLEILWGVNSLELRHGEVRRIYLPRTRVNTYSACVGGPRMNRREFFALGGAGAAAAGLSLAEAMSGGRDEPNLLVIITDDQPSYTVSHTKAVASLIRDRGTTFSPYAYVSTPICGPARATLLTGKWSHDTGLTKTAGAYQDLHASIYESDTIATRLKQAG